MPTNPDPKGCKPDITRRKSVIDTSNNKPLVIISAYQQHRADNINQDAHAKLGKIIRDTLGLDCGEVDGCYQGVEEKAWLVEFNTPHDFRCLYDVAMLLNQDSILHIAADRTAGLHYYDGTVQAIGNIECVPERVAKGCEAWTRISNGSYYVAQ